MRKMILVIALLAGCDFTPKPPTANNCVEFQHHTIKDGNPTTCQMVWCEAYMMGGNGHTTGGVATLWCQEDGNDSQASQ